MAGIFRFSNAVSDIGKFINTYKQLYHHFIAYTEEEKKGGIALVNVNNRIHLIFGEEYGMHIYSIEKQGTDVEITIPITVAGDGIIDKGMM